MSIQIYQLKSYRSYKKTQTGTKEKRAEIDYIKGMSQRIKARGAIVTALMTDAYEMSDEEFYEK